MDWWKIISGVLIPIVAWLCLTVIQLGREVSYGRSAREISTANHDKRLEAIENEKASATSERYRASDANRDLARIWAKIDQLEELQRKHEAEDRARFNRFKQ